MPLFSGSVSSSWISTNQNSRFLENSLPVTYSYVYQAPRSSAIVSQLSGSTTTFATYRMLPIEVYVTSSTMPAIDIDRLEIYQIHNIGFGLIDTQFIDYTPSVLVINLSTVYLKYALTQAPSDRKGLFIQKSTGSPHLSLEPVWPTSSWLEAGDMWFSDTSGSWRGLFYADYSSSVVINPSSSLGVIPYKIFATSQSTDLLDGGWY